MKIGFVGLGTMGFEMAGHISKKGYDVLVFNRTEAVTADWLSKFSGTGCDSISLLSGQCDIILTCVGNDKDVSQIYSGENGIFESAKPGALLIDHTTTSSKLAKALNAQATSLGLDFIDAPVSGGQAGAENGQLSVMAGGQASSITQALPILNTFSKAVTHMGESGSGQLCKMVNQICIAGVLQGLSEALMLAEATDLDIDLVKNAISGGAAGSWQLSNRLESMHKREFDFGFAIDWMRKDLSFCLDEAKSLGVNLPITEYVDKEYEKLQQRGLNRCDTSVLAKQFEE